MPGVTKVHPEVVADTFEQIGKVITWFNVAFATDASASTGPEGAIQAVYAAIQLRTTIIAAGPHPAGIGSQSFGVEGVFAADILALIQADIVALGTVDSVLLTGATVVAKTLIIT